MTALGVVVFLVVIAALFGVTYVLARRYSVGRSKQLEDITRVIALRDGNAGTPTGGFLPFFRNENPSPRERLKGPPDPRE